MISLIGNFLLGSVLVAASAAIVARGRARMWFFCFSSLAPFAAFASLVYGFVISDFSVRNVFFNSSSILPLAYKISAAWASHEGSILMWFAMLSLIAFVYVRAFKGLKDVQEFAIMILAFIQVLFGSFILFSSSPFTSFSFVPEEGMGLNPMLQDMALSIHPPILYLGNVSYVALFVSGCLLLYRPEEKKYILAISKVFSSFALFMLIMGIGLGAWWAYRELGWGGYWFFDPVENISLMPWLAGIALHHFLVVTSRNGKFMRATILLSMLAFLLTIYGTFVVRSGIVSSVHSFAFSPERGLYIFSICLILTVLALVWFFLKSKNLQIAKAPANPQEIMILSGGALWMVALLSLVLAIIYPIYCTLALDMEVVIDPKYFISIFVPIYFPLLLLAALAPTIMQKFTIRKFVVIASSIVGTFVLSYFVPFAEVSVCIAAASIYLMLQSLDYGLSSYVSRSISLKRSSLILGHFGFGMLALSITLNSLLASEVEFVGKIGDKTESNGMVVKLVNVKFTEGENYYSQVGGFDIEDKNHNILTLQPENRLYKIESSLSQEVDLHSFLFHDVYAVMSKVEKNIIHAKIYYQPFISMIWLAVMVMASGFMLLLFRR